MDIIYNGEIYLKKGPEIYNPSADIKEIDEKIEELQKLFTEDPNLFTLGIIELSKSVKSSLEKERGKLDYSGTDTFWRLYTNDGINLLMKNNFQERKYNGVEEMKRIYMKLSEFLNESSFIGKEFVTLEEVTNGSEFVDKTIKGWLDNVEPAKREQVIDVVFDILNATDAQTMKDLKANWFSSGRVIMTSYKNIDNETKDMIWKAVSELLKSAKNNIFDDFPKLPEKSK